VAAHPDGTRLVIVDKKKSIYHFDANTMAMHNYSNPFRVHNGAIMGCVWSPDGSKLATVGNDSNVIIWYDGHSGHRLKWEAHCQALSQVAWIDDTNLITAGGERALKTWTIPATWA